MSVQLGSQRWGIAVPAGGSLDCATSEIADPEGEAYGCNEFAESTEPALSANKDYAWWLHMQRESIRGCVETATAITPTSMTSMVKGIDHEDLECGSRRKQCWPTRNAPGRRAWLRDAVGR